MGSVGADVEDERVRVGGVRSEDGGWDGGEGLGRRRGTRWGLRVGVGVGERGRGRGRVLGRKIAGEETGGAKIGRAEADGDCECKVVVVVVFGGGLSEGDIREKVVGHQGI